MNYKIFPLGDNALTIEFGNEISVHLNNYVLKLNIFFERNRFSGLIETVPAYSSLTIFYDVPTVRRNYADAQTAFETVKNFTERGLENLNDLEEQPARLMEIPICFAPDFAPDLDFISSENSLPIETVIKKFLDKKYRVFMLGFLPGFTYMGEIDEKIVTPRKTTPRLKVPAGSVGIAGKQTGIYSLESPGGWQIIGRTPIKLFIPREKNPTYLKTGDTVKFYQVDSDTFSKIARKNEK